VARGHQSRGGPQGRDRDTDSEFIDKLVHINRVAKVVKGGRRFSFSALVIVGDGRSRVGYGLGKANEVPEAIRKAVEKARRTMVKVALAEGGTIPHEEVGRCGATRVVMRPASPGTGVIAGGPLRAIFECLGVQDVVAKSVGSSNPHNMIKAAFDALTRTSSPRSVAARRGVKVAQIAAKRGATAEAETEGAANG